MDIQEVKEYLRDSSVTNESKYVFRTVLRKIYLAQLDEARAILDTLDNWMVGVGE
jgi:hypothetical protein